MPEGMKMSRIKAELMTPPIKFYLRQYVTKAGEAPMALPSERILCARFNVARGTVRDAIRQLEEDDVLIRLPGRKGVFTNPRFYNPHVRMIGLISHTSGGYASEFPAEVALIQSGFFSAMSRNAFYCNIMFPDRFPEEELIRFFSNQNLEVMIWFNPDLFYRDLIIRLRDGGVPLFTASATYRVKFSLPESPNDFFPAFTALDSILRMVKTISPRAALFCFHKDKQHFCEWGNKVMEDAELGGIRKEIRNFDSSRTDILSGILRQDPDITVLYADGGWYLRKPFVVEAVKESGRKDIVILLENNYSSLLLKKEHPEMNLVVIDAAPILESYRKTGETAAKEILQYIANKKQGDGK